MKSQLLKTLLIAGTTMFFFACSTGNKTESNDYADDQTEAADEAPAEEAMEIDQVLTVWHHVEDYNTWKSVYDKVDHSAENDGIVKMVVGAEVGNPNHVFVGENITDKDKALAFFESDELAAAIEEAGVVGEMEMNFHDVLFIGPPNNENLNRVMMQFKVKDFDTYKTVTNAEAGTNNDYGITMIFEGRDQDDPNLLSYAFVLEDKAKFDAYMASDKFKSLREKSGMEGDINVRFFSLYEYVSSDS